VTDPSQDPPAGDTGHEDTTVQRRATTRTLVLAWAGWLALAVTQNGIWLASRLSGQGDQSYWPIWVMLPLGTLLLAYTIWTVAAGKASRRSDPRR